MSPNAAASVHGRASIFLLVVKSNAPPLYCGGVNEAARYASTFGVLSMATPLSDSRIGAPGRSEIALLLFLTHISQKVHIFLGKILGGETGKCAQSWRQNMSAAPFAPGAPPSFPCFLILEKTAN